MCGSLTHLGEAVLSKYLLFLYYGPSCVLHSDSFSVHDTGSELIMVLLKNLQHGRKNCQTSYSDIQVPSSAGHDIPFCLILTASLKKKGGGLCTNLCGHPLILEDTAQTFVCTHSAATILPRSPLILLNVIQLSLLFSGPSPYF